VKSAIPFILPRMMSTHPKPYPLQLDPDLSASHGSRVLKEVFNGRIGQNGCLKSPSTNAFFGRRLCYGPVRLTSDSRDDPTPTCGYQHGEWFYPFSQAMGETPSPPTWSEHQREPGSCKSPRRVRMEVGRKGFSLGGCAGQAAFSVAIPVGRRPVII
jgi:hypothetical protein